ncbi:MAG: phage major tail protein, TP901-1 family [Rhodobacteraceae bacterium]|nr:MAG: phage major tail protein, TP901-1 family [Paracoccaceae bacterium]
MAAQRGRDLLVRLAVDGGGFETVAGLRATRLSLGAAMVNATTADSPGRWRELLAGAGAQSASVSGSGVFRDAASDAALRRAFFEGATPTFRLTIPDFGEIDGPFQITTLEYAGEHDGEAVYQMALESAGALTFREL